MEYGSHFCWTISKMNMVHDAKYCMKETAKMTKSKLEGHVKDKFKILIAKMTILQKLENETKFGPSQT